MSDEPKVTFIICNYNYEQYLGDAIKSALKQTYPNVSVCVIDDSSKNVDQVEEVVKANLFPNGIISEEFVGNMRIWTDNNNSAIFLEGGPYKQAHARNVGMRLYEKNTDFFMILDADDIAHPQKAEVLIKPMLSSNHIAVVYADYETINVLNDRKCREFKEPYDFFRLRQECIVHSGSLVRVSALQHIKENGDFFDIDLPPVEDYDLWMRLSEKFMFVHIPEALTLVRVHPNNSTNTTTHNHRISKLQRIYEKIAKREHRD